MPLNPGNHTVNFLTETYNTSGPLGVTQTETVNTQGGCFMQPVSGRDDITNTSYADATWKCISPTSDITQAMKAEDYLRFNSVKYRILYTKPYYDNWGRLDHITFFCKEETG